MPGGYHCYEVDFEPRLVAGIPLADDLLDGSVTTTKLWRLCVPAAINGLLANKHRDHLLGYNLDARSSNAGLGLVKGVTVVDQFGTMNGIELYRRDLMNLPSAVSVDGPPQPLTDPELDDFACYRLRRARRPPGNPKVVIDDQFVTGLHLDIKEPLRVCLSASRAGQPRLDPADALMCYRTRPGIGFPIFRGPESPVFVNNNLPDASTVERVNHLRELCVPAVVTLP